MHVAACRSAVARTRVARAMASTHKTAVTAPDAPKAVGPYSHAIKANGAWTFGGYNAGVRPLHAAPLRAPGLVWVSGQVGLNPATGALASGVEAQAAQARGWGGSRDPQGPTLVPTSDFGRRVACAQALANVEAVLRASGCTADDVVKTTVLLVAMSDFAAVNAVYGAFFTAEAKPARATFAVAALPLGALVEIECVAMARD